MSFLVAKFRKVLLWSEEYIQLEKNDVSDYKGPEGESFLNTSSPQRISGCRRQYYFSLFLNCVLSTLLIAVGVFELRKFPEMKTNDNTIIRKTSAYCITPNKLNQKDQTILTMIAPLLNKIEFKLEPTWLNGSFLDEGAVPSPYRALPGEEADKAWHAIGEPEWIIINENDARQLGKDPSTLVRAPEDWGYGNDAFIAMMDLNHQLHCINQVRQAAFPEHYPNTRSKEFKEQHIMHCIYMMYQKSMSCIIYFHSTSKWYKLTSS
jgi:hypothetical protein